MGSPLNAPPTFSTSYHTHRDAVGSSATDLTEDGPSFYTRRGNPTLDLLERRLAALPASPSAWKTPTT